MDVRAFCSQSRVLIVAGKGGVGKTTMVAALAHLAAGVGLSVLVVELEGRAGMARAFGGSGTLSYEPAVLAGDGEAGGTVPPGTVQARTITPDDALLEYLADHGMRRVSKRLMASGVIDLVAGAIPGIRDILVLGKVKQLERAEMADLILVDAPATGHAMTFLSSASGLLDAARGGPIRAQAAEVVDLLSDARRCQVTLVTLPEEMPVNEVVEAAYQLEDRIGIALGPVLVNGCYPPLGALEVPAAEAARAAGVDPGPAALDALEAARAFRRTRQLLQDDQLARLAHDLPLPQVRLPYLFSEAVGPAELDQLRDALAEGVAGLHDPAGATS